VVLAKITSRARSKLTVVASTFKVSLCHWYSTAVLQEMQPSPPTNRVPASPPAFLELPGYAPSSFSPQILVHPLEDRISYLDGDSVSGVVYVKGAGHGWKLDQV
jgi:hypothetical protein